MSISCFVFLVLAVVASEASSGWSYEGSNNPSTWHHSYPDCAKSSQSPIDIPYYNCVVTRWPFTLNGLHNKMTVNVVNNGHAVQANLPKNAGVNFDVDGTTYIVEQFHFHWGKQGSGKGSEHTIGGQAYPLELHVVAYDQQYQDVTDAADKRGLAVLGFLFEEGAGNSFLTKLTAVNLQGGHGAQQSHPVNDFSFYDLIGDYTLYYGYYRYDGSLTTPACYEGVKWTVFRDMLSVSSQQLSVFRTKTGITHNYRPVQPLNGRTVGCW